MLILWREWELPGVLRELLLRHWVCHAWTAGMGCPHLILCMGPEWVVGSCSVWHSIGGFRRVSFRKVCVWLGVHWAQVPAKTWQGGGAFPIWFLRKALRWAISFDFKVSGARNISSIWACTIPWPEGILPVGRPVDHVDLSSHGSRWHISHQLQWGWDAAFPFWLYTDLQMEKYLKFWFGASDSASFPL